MTLSENVFANEVLGQLTQAADTLRYTYQRCLSIGEKETYSEEEEERLEALTSKFARLSDMIVKQAVKVICMLDLEEAPETIRDTINRAEKKGLIASAEKFIEIRHLRNDIAHEYAGVRIREVYRGALNFTPQLLDAVPRIKAYMERSLTSK
jgi:uncharacterized protein YutE (UPF0331/DUF86 family)